MRVLRKSFAALSETDKSPSKRTSRQQQHHQQLRSPCHTSYCFLMQHTIAAAVYHQHKPRPWPNKDHSYSYQTLVDLPGLIHSATKASTEADKDLIFGLVEGYMQNPRTIILAVVSAKNDAANQIILSMFKKIDRKGSQTLGIITKPDCIQGAADEQFWFDLAGNKEVLLERGWHMVKDRAVTHHLGDQVLRLRQPPDLCVRNRLPRHNPVQRRPRTLAQQDHYLGCAAPGHTERLQALRAYKSEVLPCRHGLPRAPEHSIARLPNDVIIRIVQRLDTQKDCSRFARVRQRFYPLVTNHLAR
jgi:hypothetical protein